MKLNKINILIAVISLLVLCCLFLNFQIFRQKKSHKRELDSLQISFLEQHRALKIEKVLKDSFNLTDERARICATLIDVYAQRWEIEWEKLAALMRVESNFNYYAKSQLTKGSKNEQLQRAYGLMQIKPTTAKICADELGIEWNGLETVQNPIENVKMGAYYYAKQNLVFNDFRKNINAYNSGPQAVYNKSESINNWNRVNYHYKRLKGIQDLQLAEIVKKLDEEYIAQKDSLQQDTLKNDSLNENKKITHHRRKK